MPCVFVIDPGLRFAGITAFADGAIIYSETLKFNTKLPQQKRIFNLFDRMEQISKIFPEVTVVITEYQFVSQMSWIVGCLMTFAGSIDAELIKYTPSQWKKMATGKGNISEEELRNIIIEKYPESIEYSEHQIDTLGMYLAYEKSGENNVSPSKKPNKRKNSSKNKTN